MFNIKMRPPLPYEKNLEILLHDWPGVFFYIFFYNPTKAQIRPETVLLKYFYLQLIENVMDWNDEML